MFKKLFMGLIALMVVSAAFTMQAEARSISIDGSSTVFPITEAVAEEFTKATRGAIRVTVGLSGTGGGFGKFCRGETDISNASRPIRAAEMDLCRKNGIDFIEIPVGYDGLAVVINPKNNWVKSMTRDDLKKIWEPAAERKIVRWNQVRPEWPDRPLTLFGPGTASGTFDSFTEMVVGKARASRADYTASEDDHVLVVGVAGDTNALGYFGLAYYIANKDRLTPVPIVDPKTGRAVLPTKETVMDGSYIFARPLFIYVSRKAAERSEVREFVDFYLKNATKLVAEVGYVPLTPGVYKLAEDRFQKRRTGTMFVPGTEGLTIEALLRR